tara:strand:- start:84 stop:551 length:468 start_codon:yes stop_codon:yes gene_type:complete
MATIKIQGNASGSGTLIIEAPNTNSARTLTLPDAAGELLTTTGDGSGLTGISSGAAVVGTLRGTGTIALQNSKGVSSVSDYGTGKYGFNFSSNFPNATYYASGTTSHNLSAYWAYITTSFSGGVQDNTRTTSQCRIGSYTSSFIDTPSVGLMASE